MKQEIIASVQYGDFRGTAAADLSDVSGNSLEDFARKHGVKGWPVGFGIYVGERGKPQVRLYVCKEAAGFDDILKHAKSQGGELNLEEVSVPGEIAIDEFFALFKRFDVAMINKLRNEQIEITTGRDE